MCQIRQVKRLGRIGQGLRFIVISLARLQNPSQREPCFNIHPPPQHIRRGSTARQEPRRDHYPRSCIRADLCVQRQKGFDCSSLSLNVATAPPKESSHLDKTRRNLSSPLPPPPIPRRRANRISPSGNKRRRPWFFGGFDAKSAHVVLASDSTRCGRRAVSCQLVGMPLTLARQKCQSWADSLFGSSLLSFRTRS